MPVLRLLDLVRYPSAGRATGLCCGCENGDSRLDEPHAAVIQICDGSGCILPRDVNRSRLDFGSAWGRDLDARSSRSSVAFWPWDRPRSDCPSLSVRAIAPSSFGACVCRWYADRDKVDRAHST